MAGFELIANKDSDNVGVVRIDENTGMSAVPAFDDTSGSGGDGVVTKRHVEPRMAGRNVKPSTGGR
jgi:hypothetical protein